MADYYIDLLVGGIRPHLYCLPILKAEVHRQALVRAATSGSPKFFLGTDSAPHDIVTAKETACGCAGIYTAHAAVELYAEVFDTTDDMDQGIAELATKLANSNPDAMRMLKEVFWQGTEHWDELLAARAAMSGELVLSDFTVNAINAFKKK